MLGYRRKSFNRAVEMLHEIRRHPENLSVLMECQRLLLREVLLAEAHIGRVKIEVRAVNSELKTARPTKERSQRLKARRKYLDGRIEGYRQLRYIWRSFGDGIAFSYIDKHALKHTFYNTESLSAKLDAGFLSGKDGLANEMALVERAAATGMPSLLVDLTNSIRHGDVCLLAASDPYLIEVKSGGRLDERALRQVEAIEKLHSFYETDIAKGLRGLEEIRRSETPTAEVNYASQMNFCIQQVALKGSSVINPEEGLYYAALYGGGTIEETFHKIPAKQQIVWTLNTYKSSRTWSPYRPFTLSIEHSAHLYDFIQGNLFLLVVVDVSVLCKLMAHPGFEISYADGGEYPLKATNIETAGVGGISEHLLGRIGMEFSSPAWVVSCFKASLERALERVAVS